MILLITYRSRVLWLLPVISSVVALITAQAVIYLLAAHAGLTVTGMSAAILYVLVFGAYTVILALLTLSAAEMNSTKSLGPVLAIGVAVGMFSMLTLLPALMVIFPRGVFWPSRPAYGSAEPTYRGMWARIGWAIAPRPRRVWVTTAVVLGVLALGLAGLKASGLTDAQVFRGHPDSVTGQAVLAAHFPAGTDDPVVVIGNQNAAAALRSALAATGGVITSAGFVLAATFAVLATIPLTTLTEIGFTVAFGILLDTIVVRSVLVTALNLDVGHRIWWPSKLARKPDPAPEQLRQERTAALAAG